MGYPEAQYVVDELTNMIKEGPQAVVEALAEQVVSHGAQEFDSSGTFVVPDGVTEIIVTAIGGGGGGGGGGASSYYIHDNQQPGAGGGGGGGGAMITHEIKSK